MIKSMTGFGRCEAVPVDKGRVAAWFARIALPLMAILIWLLYL